MRCLLGILLPLLLTGCGLFAGEPDSPQFASSSAIQRALGAAGLSCHNFQSMPAQNRESGMENAADVGECQIDGETPRLVIWSDNEQKDRWAESSRQIGCAMAHGFGVSSFNYVAGERWSITDTSQKLANRLSDAIGGEVVHVECEEQ